MPQDTPEIDAAARSLAEAAYAAYARQATAPAEPLAEQNAVTRIVEAIRMQLPKGSAEDVAAAINAALDAWETREPGLRGPRVERIDLAAGTVSLRPR